MKKILLLVLVSVLSSAMLFGCKKSETAAADTLIVGTNAEFPPFEYIEQGQIVGFDVDLMNEISKLTGKKVEFKNMAFDSLLIAMQTGKINCIVSGMTATDERRQHVNFSTPYFVSKQAVIVPENSDIKKFEDLKGKKIGVVIGYTGDMVVTDMYKDTSSITRYEATGQAIMALTAGKVDAAVLDMEPAKEYVANNEGIKVLDTALAEEEYSIALPKDKTGLLDEINKALQTLKENGTYDKIYAKYFNK